MAKSNHSILSTLSLREKNLWCETLVSAVVVIYFFSRSFALFALGDDALMGREMTRLIIKTMVLTILLSIVVYGLVYGTHTSGGKQSEPLDERDRLFSLRSYQAAYAVLTLLACLLIGHIVLSQFSGVPVSRPYTPLSPLMIAHLLLAAVSAASLVKAATALFYYRRGY